MITRHHLVLALMCSLILGIAVFPSAPGALAALAGGACIGAVLPDIHMTKPKRRGFRTITWYITRFSACICIPALCQAYYAFWEMNLCPSDKRLTHSVPGSMFIGVTVIAIAAVPVLLLGPSPMSVILLAFISGILSGLILHFMEDICTRKGVTPFFPFSSVKIAGSIRPCDRTDSRIAQYHVHHCWMAVVVIGLHSAGHWTEPLSLSVSLIALALCLGLMVWFSDVHIETGKSATGFPDH